jgi:hypothetical protein
MSVVNDDAVIVVDLVKGRIKGYVERIDTPEVEQAVLFYLDAVFQKEAFEVHELDVFDIFVFELAVQRHLFVSKGVTVDIEAVGCIFDRQETGKIRKMVLGILILLREGILSEEHVFVVKFERLRLFPVPVGRVADIEKVCQLFPEPV